MYVCLNQSLLQLARKYHPDTNPDKGAQEKFVEIQEAYDVSHFPSFRQCMTGV